MLKVSISWRFHGRVHKERTVFSFCRNLIYFCFCTLSERTCWHVYRNNKEKLIKSNLKACRVCMESNQNEKQGEKCLNYNFDESTIKMWKGEVSLSKLEGLKFDISVPSISTCILIQSFTYQTLQLQGMKKRREK